MRKDIVETTAATTIDTTNTGRSSKGNYAPTTLSSCVATQHSYSPVWLSPERQLLQRATHYRQVFYQHDPGRPDRSHNPGCCLREIHRRAQSFLRVYVGGYHSFDFGCL